MIKASEAKQLVEMSNKNVEKFLSQIDPKIRELAEKGERLYECYVQGLWHSEESYMPIKTTPLQERIIDELHAVGFGARMVCGEPYVPRSRDEDGQKICNQYIEVTW